MMTKYVTADDFSKLEEFKKESTMKGYLKKGSEIKDTMVAQYLNSKEIAEAPQQNFCQGQ